MIFLHSLFVFSLFAENVPSLLLEGNNDRMIAQGVIILQRRQHIQDALSLFNKDFEKPLEIGDPRIPAIEVLGALRAEQGVKTLIQSIGLRTLILVDVQESKPNPAELYPAARALIRIGKQASKECFKALGETSNDERRKTLCWVIKAIEGEDVGRFLLLKAIEATKNPPSHLKRRYATAARNLKAALGYFPAPKNDEEGGNVSRDKETQ